MRKSTKEDYLLLARHLRGFPLDPAQHYKEWKGWWHFLGHPEPGSENKKKLLRLAQNKRPRPNYKKGNKLGANLTSYTSKKSDSYDPIFDTQIRKAAPHWFVDTAVEKKQELLAIAKSGDAKPTAKHRLGTALMSYISKSQCYDNAFDKQVRKSAPHWFVDTAAENKKKLLKIAKKSEARPNHESKLGVALGNYTRKYSWSYDTAFDTQIRKAAPHWFINTATENKKKLLKIAKNKRPKPIATRHPLGIVLGSYTNQSHRCYDPAFDNRIRKSAPHWFVDTAAENKKKLLRMAKNGGARPNKHKHKIGAALVSYTGKSKCYDPVFDKQIRKLAPQWFVDTAAEKKKKLLEMARNKEPRPDRRKFRIGTALTTYCSKSSSCYDPAFDRQIRTLRQDWFR